LGKNRRRRQRFFPVFLIQFIGQEPLAHILCDLCVSLRELFLQTQATLRDYYTITLLVSVETGSINEEPSGKPLGIFVG
jgi:hypothetical protein